MEKLTNSLFLSVTGAIIIGSLGNYCSPSTDEAWQSFSKNKENEVYLATESDINIEGMYANISSTNEVLPMNKELLNNLKKLDDIGNLEENWNGYSSTTFSKTFIKEIKQNVLMLVRQPEIYPIAYGNIQFEYDREDGGYLEFEISPQNIIKCYREKNDGTYKEYQISDFEMINQEVRNFYEL